MVTDKSNTSKVNPVIRFLGFHTPEVVSLTGAALVLSVGIDFAWHFNAIWLDRAGALLTIIGVLLASWRFHERIQSKAGKFVEDNFETITAKPLADIAKDAALDNAERRNALKAEIKAEIDAELSAIFASAKQRVKNIEIALVVVGTFLHGFGEYIVELLKPYF